MRHVLLTKPALLPITLAEAKAHVRIDTTVTEDDTMLLGYIRAATDQAERYLGRSLITQTWTLYLNCFLDETRLPRSPVQSVTSVKYDDTADAEQTLSATIYEADTVAFSGRVVLRPSQVWPTLTATSDINRVRIEYVAGYGDNPTDVPDVIKQGILFLVAHFFEERQVMAIGTIATTLQRTVAALWEDERLRYP